MSFLATTATSVKLLVPNDNTLLSKE